MRRIVGAKKTGYSVLIVCEGVNTEPAYFESLESYIRINYSEHYKDGIAFEIFPYGPEVLEEFEKEDELFSRKKNTRVIRHSEQEINDDIEEEYYAAPVRWVRYAQINSINSGYNQVWSVFDYDNRQIDHIKKSFELAKEPVENGINEVQIAFSSYSFEYWILLHYTLYESYLGSSECKEGKNSILCGTKIHADDCEGQKCLAGCIYLFDSEVGGILKTKKSTFPFIESSMKNAHIRAEYMKELHSLNTTNIWEMHPVTTMNKMLEYLIPDFGGVKWHLNINEFIFKNWTLFFFTDGINLNARLITNGKETILIPTNGISILDENFDKKEYNSRIYITDEGESDVLVMNLSEIPFIPKFASVKFGSQTNYIKLNISVN